MKIRGLCMKNTKVILVNERGGMAALLSVVVLSMIMVSTLSAFYIYIENRAKFQERIRVNYQMGYVMEDISRAIVQAREQYLTTGCPAAQRIFIDCTEVCGTQTRTVGSIPGLPGTVTADTPNVAVCVRNDTLNKIVNNADYFCAYNTDTGDATVTPTVPPAYCAGVVKNENLNLDGAETQYAMAPTPKNKVRSWYSRLDKFFDTTLIKNVPGVSNQMQYALNAQIKAPTVLGWLIPDKAIANNDPPIGYPPTGGHPTQPNIPMEERCAADPVFCKGSNAGVDLDRIGDPDHGCQGETDPRCKKCAGVDRNNGACVKFSVCPPWVSADECVGDTAAGGNANDRRIHQTLMLGTPPPGGGPTCWGNVTPPTGSQNGPPGYSAANPARCAVPSIACTTPGQMMMTSCMEVNAVSGADRNMVAGYAVRCGDYSTSPGYLGCVAIPNLTPPPCGTTSTRVCYGAEASPRGDPSCCTGASICGPTNGVNATCVNGGPSGGFGGGCQTYFCNQATGMCHWMKCP